MTVVGKVAYKSVSLVGGMFAGAVAGAVFTRTWRTISDADEVPDPAELDRDVRDVLIAAALQGAVFGLAKAAIDRILAKGYRRLSGKDPNL